MLLLPMVTKLWFILQIKQWLLWIYHNPAYMHFFSSESLNKLQISRVFDINWWLKRKQEQFTTTIIILFDELGVLKKKPQISEVI